MVSIILYSPIIATVFAIINFVLVLLNLRNKPWEFKRWLIISMFFWIPWAASTVFMRLANSETEAILFLRISLISSYVCFFGLYRFHDSLIFRTTHNRINSFGVAILLGINGMLGLNQKFLTIQIADEIFYTDKFSPVLFALHMFVSIYIGFIVFKSLSNIEAFSLFYSSKKRGSSFQIFIALAILVVIVTLMVIWFGSDTVNDATGFIIISIFITSLLGITYGVNPLSAFLAPQRIWAFFMIDKGGLPVFEYHFSENERIHELILISGAINASDYTIRMHLETEESGYSEVELEDRIMILLKNNNMMFVLVADHISPQLQVIYDELVATILTHPEYKEYRPGNQKNKYEFANDLVTSAFAM